MATSTKSRQRAELRRQRRHILPAYRRWAARKIVRLFFHQRELLRARSVGVYLAMASEIATQPLINALQARRIRVFAPRIARGGQMRFFALAQGQCARLKHRLGMRQPQAQHPITAKKLDVLIMPLIGYDVRGNRLGQGGGYYDRCLAGLPTRRPLRLGLAFAAQQCATLTPDPWDQPLHAVLTERGFRRFTR